MRLLDGLHGNCVVIELGITKEDEPKFAKLGLEFHDDRVVAAMKQGRMSQSLLNQALTNRSGDSKTMDLTKESIPTSVQKNQPAMNGEPLQQTVKITNPQGFHMRPIRAFVELANQFESSIHVQNGQERANGKSILNLMGLGAVLGTDLILEVCGPDQDKALAALVDLMGDLEQFDEDEEA
ncbi:MAG: HPr family phosphocarrier protein [Gemmataceae bacterium]